MIQTWIGDVTPLLDTEIYEKYYREIPDFRREKADKIRSQKGRALSVGVWVLLQQMREHYRLSDRCVFNLSHSGKYAMCAIDDSGSPLVKVGCDVETTGEARMKIAARFFCGNELDYIMKQPEGKARDDAFYRYWVLKESFMKAVRLGMKLDMRSYEAGFDKDGKAVLVRQPQDYKEQFFYQEYEAQDIEAKMAVCSTSCDFSQLGTGHF